MNFLTACRGSTNGIVRTITVALFGPGDARSAPEASPFGIDSNPIPGMQAVFLQTSKKGAPVIAGYFIDARNVLPNQPIADVGETRLYATDKDGNEKIRMWLHSNGTAEIGGTGAAGSNTNHLPQYEALNTALQAQKTAINGQLTLIQAAIVALGGSYTKVDITIDISPSQISKILVQ